MRRLVKTQNILLTVSQVILHAAIDLRTDALPHPLLRPSDIEVRYSPERLLLGHFIVVAEGVAGQSLAYSSPG